MKKLYKVTVESDKIVRAMDAINGVAGAINTDVHINDLVKHTNRILTGEFILHMSRFAAANVRELGHMYEWNRVGDPSARLWRHVMRGRGRSRVLNYTFTPSKTKVPVSSALQAVGVQRRHIFTWKSSVIELGMPVRISPKVAKMLVFEASSTSAGSSPGAGFIKGGIVYYDGTISIPRQGSSSAWGAFTVEFRRWFASDAPANIIKNEISPSVRATVSSAVKAKMQSIRTTKVALKKFHLTPMGVDREFEKTLAASLSSVYRGLAARRRALTINDEI